MCATSRRSHTASLSFLFPGLYTQWNSLVIVNIQNCSYSPSSQGESSSFLKYISVPSLIIGMFAPPARPRLNTPSPQDIQAFGRAQLAIPTSESVEHDLGRIGSRVAVYNSCVDTTTKNLNGIVCNMHPSEGIWLFRGAPRGSCFGSMFGDHKVCGMFPTSAAKVNRPQSILVQDADCVVRLGNKPGKEPYMCFDEAYFKNLELMQWNRDNGYVELIPVVVGMA